MSTTPQRRQRDTGRREQLLEAAARCFAARPFDEVSMKDIAAEAHVAKGLLHYYFQSKRGCYLAVIEHHCAQLLPEVQLEPGDVPMRALSRVLKAYLDFAEDSPAGYRMIVAGGLGTDPDARQFAAELRTQWRQAMAQVAFPGQPEPPAFGVAIEGWLSFVEGVVLEWLTLHTITRGQLVRLITAATPVLLTASAAAEPSLQLDPSLFEGT